MSSAAETESDAMKCCACCGIAGGDDIKLKKCTACYLVKYCSVKCQKDHRSQHKKECKKRAAELKDEILFKQPESSCFGECPICCLPLDVSKSGFYTCCSKRICDGCERANKIRESEGRLEQKCPFCRKPLPTTKEESDEQWMKRVEANDPVAMCCIGTEMSCDGDYRKAFEYLTNAAALGEVEAHYQLSGLYQFGRGVEKDKKKQMHHLKEAAIGGHPRARYNLGCLEEGTIKVKHFIIAAKLGDDKSLGCVKDLYKDGFVSKEDFSAALRGHHAATIAMKSPQREEAAEFYNNR